MKCPLFHSEFIRMRAPELEQSDDCLKEECAWWDSGPECCILKSATYTLLALSQEIAAIKTKMPHAGQFTK